MSLKLSFIDKQVIQHIRQNGRMTDQVGKKLAVKFIQAALRIPTIKDAAKQYKFTSEDLCVVYTVMIECLRPNPIIAAGGPMLAATLPFMEPFRMESFMGAIHQQFPPGTPPEERRGCIVKLAEMQAHAIWTSHTAARGEAPFQIDPTGTGRASAGGCSSLFIVCFICLTAVAYYVGRSLLI